MATAPAAPAAVPPVPFAAGAQLLSEVFQDTGVSVITSAVAQSFGPYNVRASNGYLKFIEVLVEGSGGTAGTALPDAPWCLFQSIYLQDGGGTKVFGPVDGFAWYVINTYGGYDYCGDPALFPDFVGTTPNYVFSLRIPVEIHPHSGLGALPNLSGATEWQVGFTINPTTNVWSVAPSPLPTFRIRLNEVNYAQPTPTDISGHPIEAMPPLLGTVQRWQSYTDPSLPAGDYVSRFRNPGRALRTIVYVNRASGTGGGGGLGLRNALANLPEPIELSLDGTYFFKSEPIKMRRGWMLKRTRTPAVPDGVIVYFRDDLLHGMVGDGNPAQFLGLTQASRLELHSAAWVGAASTLQTVFNDVLFPGA